MIMAPAGWIKKYEDAELKSWQTFFNGGDSIEELEQVVIKMPEGINRKSIFYDLSYWKDILIYHLLDPMHNFKNVPDSNFQHIAHKEDTWSSRRDIALSHTKFDRKHMWKKKELGQLKKVIRLIRTPTRYKSSLNKAFTIDGHIKGFEPHDFHNFKKVLYIII